MGDLLLGFVLKQAKVLLFQPGDKPVQRIGYGDIDQNDRRVDPDVAARTLGFLRRGLGAGINRNLWTVSPPHAY